MASEAEGAFNQSLEDFDQIMGAEQEQIAAQGIGSAADDVFREAGAVGGNVGSGEIQGQEQGAGATGGNNSQAGAPIFTRSETSTNSTAPQVEGCEDEDTVARQLCEAATNEEDPFLRGALWDEYNEYKSILARQ
ncbi:MAG: hypothetical protein CMD70_04775 [Gammaproteobacteria bacterium]|nr:hypothetical protein [Gammaproteobacteria bacterium]